VASANCLKMCLITQNERARWIFHQCWWIDDVDDRRRRSTSIVDVDVDFSSIVDVSSIAGKFPASFLAMLETSTTLETSIAIAIAIATY
jgi:hypothetical protein